MTEVAVKVVLSYLLGSIIGSLLVGRLRGGVDIRRLGSGNAGGTNALRTQGKSFALWVMVIDVGKGWFATGVLPRLIIPHVSHRYFSVFSRPGDTDPSVLYREYLVSHPLAQWLDPVRPPGWLDVACGIAAILGHVYPIFFGFRGGKGVATLIGTVVGLNPWLLVPMLAAWFLAVILFGFVSLASILAAITLAATAVSGVLGPQLPLFVFGVLAAVLIAFTHRSNIARMRAGTEPRAQRLWLFGTRSGGA